eukprot:Nk52_evm24s2325 gene=Nk52_evmTU24s2325
MLLPTANGDNGGGIKGVHDNALEVMESDTERQYSSYSGVGGAQSKRHGDGSTGSCPFRSDEICFGSEGRSSGITPVEKEVPDVHMTKVPKRRSFAESLVGLIPQVFHRKSSRLSSNGLKKGKRKRLEKTENKKFVSACKGDNAFLRNTSEVKSGTHDATESRGENNENVDYNELINCPEQGMETPAVNTDYRDIHKRVAFDTFGCVQSELKKSLESVETYKKLMEVVMEAEKSLAMLDNIHSIMTNILEGVLELMGAAYGLIGELRTDEKTKEPYLHCFALTDISWDDFSRTFYHGFKEDGWDFYGTDNLFGLCVSERMNIISNDVNGDPRRGGKPKLPSNHPIVSSFLGMPVFNLLNGELLGLVAISNGKGGWSESDGEFLRPVVELVSKILMEHLKSGKQFAQLEREANHARVLEQSLIARSDFLSVLSHELRTPLNVISGLGSGLLEDWSEMLKAIEQGRHLSTCPPIEECKTLITESRNEAVAKFRSAAVPNEQLRHFVKMGGTTLSGLQHILDSANSLLGTVGKILEYSKQTFQTSRAGSAAGLKKNENEESLSSILSSNVFDGSTAASSLQSVYGGLESESISFYRLLGKIVETEKYNIQSHTTFGLVISPRCPDWVYGDSDNIDRVIRSVVNNALKFTDKGSVVVEVSVASEEDYQAFCANGDSSGIPDTLNEFRKASQYHSERTTFVLIKVQDSGIGIPPACLPHIFEPFFQTNGGQRRRFDGVGLGLSLAKETIEGLGGFIYADSKPGLGTCVSILLPLEIQEDTVTNMLNNFTEYPSICPALWKNENYQAGNISFEVNIKGGWESNLNSRRCTEGTKFDTAKLNKSPASERRIALIEGQVRQNDHLYMFSSKPRSHLGISEEAGVTSFEIDAMSLLAAYFSCSRTDLNVLILHTNEQVRKFLEVQLRLWGFKTCLFHEINGDVMKAIEDEMFDLMFVEEDMENLETLPSHRSKFGRGNSKTFSIPCCLLISFKGLTKVNSFNKRMYRCPSNRENTLRSSRVYDWLLSWPWTPMGILNIFAELSSRLQIIEELRNTREFSLWKSNISGLQTSPLSECTPATIKKESSIVRYVVSITTNCSGGASRNSECVSPCTVSEPVYESESKYKQPGLSVVVSGEFAEDSLTAASSFSENNLYAGLTKTEDGEFCIKEEDEDVSDYNVKRSIDMDSERESLASSTPPNKVPAESILEAPTNEVQTFGSPRRNSDIEHLCMKTVKDLLQKFSTPDRRRYNVMTDDEIFKRFLKARDDNSISKNSPLNQSSAKEKSSNGVSHSLVREQTWNEENSHFCVLVVDDNVCNRKVFSMMLGVIQKSLSVTDQKRIVIDYAVNGNEAIECANGRKYQLIFMDVRMPFCDGIESVRAIRGNPEQCGYPVIAMVTAAEENAREKSGSVKAGANFFIQKPVATKIIREIFNLVYSLCNFPSDQ